MKNYIDIVSYILSGLITIISLVSLFFSSRKSKLRGNENNSKDEKIKNLEAINKDLSLANTTFSKAKEIIDYIPIAIEESEKSGLSNGPAKKVYALSLIMLKCSEKGVDYQENANIIAEKIENLISFSKEVNAKKEE